MKKTQYTLAELTRDLDVTINGDANSLIRGIAPIQEAEAGCITFLTDSSLSSTLYRKYLTSTQASAVILTPDEAENCPVTAVITRNPYYVYAKVAAFFEEQQAYERGIHATATIAKDASIDPTASIGPNCVIGAGAKIAANAVIGAGTSIGDAAEIGEAAWLDANVTIYHHVKIGKRTRLSSGVVIGSDGFGFANQRGVWHKVPQMGSVLVGDDVDIGANTTIDRGAIEDTVIGNGVKLDNLIQIGHNVKIGDHTIIAGCVGIAGSTVIGANCMIGGGALIIGHITICDRVVITGGTGVEKSITEPGMYSSGVIGVVPTRDFRRNNARFYRLEDLSKRVKSLEAALQALAEKGES